MTWKMYDGMSEPAKRFYAKVFNTSMINMIGVQRGFYDRYIADMTEPIHAVLWNEAMPQVLALIQQEIRNRKKDEDGR